MNEKFLKFLKFNLNSVRNSEIESSTSDFDSQTEDDKHSNSKNLTYNYETLPKKDLKLWLLNYTNPIMKSTNFDEHDKIGIFRFGKSLQRLERFIIKFYRRTKNDVLNF